MRAAITAGKTSSPELLAVAPPGYLTMRGDGLLKASTGQTTVDEVLRATQDVGGM
jgi:type II secretory ATPase GspE/PulE/Tfp pilus assembly ATPase PilB-like protein